MPAAKPAAFALPARLGWAAIGLGLLAGMAAQLSHAALWPLWGYVAEAASGLVCLAAMGRARDRHAMTPARCLVVGVLTATVAASIGWGWAGARAVARLAEVLPSALEGRDLQVDGVIASLPVVRSEGVRFALEVDAARLDGVPVNVPHRLMLGWYAGGRDGGPDALLAAGQRWRFTVRLKQPHGSVNPHGFDYELWLFEQGIRATGYVREGGRAERLGDAPCCTGLVDRWRQRVRDALQRQLGDSAEAGLLAALSIGDQAAIARDDWQVFRVTGVAHLVAISGLHITMFAWLASRLGGWLWRRSVWLMRVCPAPVASRWLGCVAAAAYALMAGWGVPAQRTVCMLVVACLLRQAGLRWPWPAQLLVVASVVCLVDPWALLQPGFWLSFVAVAVLMADGVLGVAPLPGSVDEPAAAMRYRDRLRTQLVGALRAQVLASVVLAPLTLLLFQQASVVGFVANLVAIPVVTLLLTPLALLGVAAPPLWTVAAQVAGGWMQTLDWLAGWPGANWLAAAPPPWAMGLALLGLVLLALPLPLMMRGLGVWLVVPLFLPPLDRPVPGAFELLAADVGQGNAVLVRTAHHALLYDAGPQYSRDNDAGERVLVPLLQALGVSRLDVLMLSHRDTDHVGGASAVLRGIGAHRVTSSLEAGHPLRRAGVPHQPCAAGQRWRWDGVAFEVLHPERSDTVAPKPNALSCVLRIESAEGRVALLVGDIEQPQEARLLAMNAPLRADVLLVPHHGSKTSSSPAWIEAVSPRWAVVQAGYRNRFGHPAAEVAARYIDRRIELVRTDQCGAWLWSSSNHAAHCLRDISRRYWRWHTISAEESPP